MLREPLFCWNTRKRENTDPQIETRAENRTYLEVAKLRELLAAAIESTDVGLGWVMDNHMRSNIASLSESFVATWA